MFKLFRFGHIDCIFGGIEVRHACGILAHGKQVFPDLRHEPGLAGDGTERAIPRGLAVSYQYDTRRDPALEGAAGGYRTAYRDIHHEIYQHLR